MNISFDNINNQRENYFAYVRDRPRYATMTDVVFINQRLLLCASFADRNIIIYDLGDADKGAFSGILDNHVYEPYNANIELIDYDHNNSLIYSSHVLLMQVRISTLMQSKIIEMQIIDMSNFGQIHGVHVYQNSVYCTSIYPTGFLIKDQQIIYQADAPQQIQDICCYKHYQFITTTKCSVSKFKNRNEGVEFPESSIIEITTDAHFKFDKSRFDGIYIDSETAQLFVCDQYNSKVLIFKIIEPMETPDKISLMPVTEITDLPFCHGCHYYQNKLATACYGNNSIKIELISDYLK